MFLPVAMGAGGAFGLVGAGLGRGGCDDCVVGFWLNCDAVADTLDLSATNCLASSALLIAGLLDTTDDEVALKIDQHLTSCSRK